MVSAILNRMDVTPGLVPGVYTFPEAERLGHRVDARHEAGHDDVSCADDEAGEGAAR
ncbi:hypothetical protein Acid7E03_31900 [Acidisoma sp. 7E03]